MKQIKLLIAIVSLLVVTNASAKSIDIEMGTNISEAANKVLNENMKKMNKDLFDKMESENNKLMLSLQEDLDIKMSKFANANNDTDYIYEDLHKIHAEQIQKMKEKYKDKKYLCFQKKNNTSI